jgi:hypothetical protein
MNQIFDNYYNEFENNNVSLDQAKKIQYDAMGDDTIRKYFPDAETITYDELKKYNSIDSLLPNNNSFIYLLYQSSPNYGHWTLLSRYNINNIDIIEYFDSYGGYIDEPLEWSETDNHKLGQGKTYLSSLLDGSNYDIIYNAYDFQNEDNLDIATCGRWCVLRNMTIQNNNMSLDNFIKMMKFLKSKTNEPYDIIVSDLINQKS